MHEIAGTFPQQRVVACFLWRYKTKKGKNDQDGTFTCGCISIETTRNKCGMVCSKKEDSDHLRSIQLKLSPTRI